MIRRLPSPAKRRSFLSTFFLLPKVDWKNTQEESYSIKKKDAKTDNACLMNSFRETTVRGDDDADSLFSSSVSSFCRLISFACLDSVTFFVIFILLVSCLEQWTTQVTCEYERELLSDEDDIILDTVKRASSLREIKTMSNVKQNKRWQSSQFHSKFHAKQDIPRKTSQKSRKKVILKMRLQMRLQTRDDDQSWFETSSDCSLKTTILRKEM